MIAALLLAAGVTVSWTYPSTNAAPSGCGPAAADPLTDLGWLQLVLVRGADTIWTQPRSAVGREGQRDSTVLDLDGDWLVLSRTSDRTEPDVNWSCLSAPVPLHGSAPLSAPAPVALVRQEFFDLMGRHVQGPTRPGIYWKREVRADGSRVRKLVVLTR